ncbi:MAG: hypothetical protein KGL39_14040 [Patescibacteria group bacterium]|nr:hypothetical protein [Patescibacteria group bacterium]
MSSLLLKYGLPVLVVLGVIVGVYFYGHSVGEITVQAQFNAYKTAQAQADLLATQAAKTAQQQADTAAIAAAQQAVAQANAAVVSRETDLKNVRSVLSRLQSEVSGYAKSSPTGRWLAEPIPPDLVARMCLTTRSGPSANCARSGSPLSAHPGGAH